MRALSLALVFAVAFVGAPVVRAQDAAPPPANAGTPPAATDAAPANTATPDANAATTTPPPAAAEPTAPATSTEQGKGMLSLTSTPPGKVFIDDKDTGLTTPVTDFAVPAGNHTVKIVADDGRTTTSEFTIEAGGSLSLNLNLPEAATPADATKPADGAPADANAAPADANAAPAPAADVAAAAPVDDWSWMTVSGWAGLGLGTIGLLTGAVVLTTPTDPDQGPLGFGLFGGGVGLVLGGAVLLYLDNELGDAEAAAPEQPKAAMR